MSILRALAALASLLPDILQLLSAPVTRSFYHRLSHLPFSCPTTGPAPPRTFTGLVEAVTVSPGFVLSFWKPVDGFPSIAGTRGRLRYRVPRRQLARSSAHNTVFPSRLGSLPSPRATFRSIALHTLHSSLPRTPWALLSITGTRAQPPPTYRRLFHTPRDGGTFPFNLKG